MTGTGASKTTLRRWEKELLHPNKSKNRVGRPSLIPDEFQAGLASALARFQATALWGWPTRDIPALVNQFVAGGGLGEAYKNKVVDRHWCDRFMKKQKKTISARRASNFSSKHKKADPLAISVFFSIFSGLLRLNNAGDDKYMLHNMDETKVTAPPPKLGRVAATPGARNVRSMGTVEEPTAHLTALATTTFGHGVATMAPVTIIKATPNHQMNGSSRHMIARG